MRYNPVTTAYLRSSMLARLLIIIIFIILLFGIAIHYIEPENFPSIFDGIWWVIVTASTVGYGDFSPHTVTGRIVAIFLILAGASFVTYYFANISSYVIERQNAFIEGKTAYRGSRHLVVIGWNERARQTIEQLQKVEGELEIVLIDNSLKKNPLTGKQIHFVRGNTIDDNTLRDARVHEAKLVLITADQHRTEIEADMQSILALLAVKGLNPEAYCVIELLTGEQVNNALRAGADEIIQTNQITSYVMINSLVSNGMTEAVNTLLDHLKGNKFTYMKVPPGCINGTFSNCSQLLFNDRMLLIGVRREGVTLINPEPSYMLHENDELLVISS
ncbi:potassium channel family protein [Bacillus marinisedimentorum]|uniref:potassium channel family protein n=1 Tax=Bacillus marinisedimentorum TaxID=1821260 RepID=UPI001FDF0122|nr:potassium channel family protein [Bacillus marinisedimentorum]